MLPLIAMVIALPRLNRVSLISIIWVLAAVLPGAILMATWQGETIDRRYLYLPAVGLCVLSAQILYSLRGRRLWAIALFTAAFTWALLWDVSGLWKLHRDSIDPSQQATYQEFCSEMSALDPRWDCQH